MCKGQPPYHSRTSRLLTYYGPHPCPLGCGSLVVQTAAHQYAYRFDMPDGPIYPNTRWEPHVCRVAPPPPHQVPPHTPGWSPAPPAQSYVEVIDAAIDAAMSRPSDTGATK